MSNEIKHENPSPITNRPSPGHSKVALVTGGSRGLGKDVALGLAEMGYRVAVNYLKESSSASEVLKLAGG